MKSKFLLLLIVLLVNIHLLESCKKCVDVDVPYTEQEPYEAIEEVDVILTYEVGQSSWNRESGATLLGIKPKLISYTYLTNTSDKGGTFEIVEKYKSSFDETITLRDSKFVSSGETVKFEFSYELDDYVQVKFDSYDVNPPTVKIEKKVTKYRTVTKYRKCNTCVEDCGEYYEKKQSNWWIWILVVGVLLVLGKIFK